MNVQEIANIISTMGFPIICCIFMWRYLTTTMTEITQTMVKNTEVLQRLVEKLDKGGNENAGD